MLSEPAKISMTHPPVARETQASALPKPRKTFAPSKAVKVAGLAVAGTFVVALILGWVAFLLWLAAEVVIAVVHWL